jgi:death-on-curing protein
MVSLGSVEKYTSVFSKAAALFHSLTKNHPFHNGNKRTALVTLLSMLHHNDYSLRASDNDVYGLVMSVTADTFPKEGHGLSTDGVVEALASWIRTRSTRIDPKISSMTRDEFIKRCERAGAHSRSTKGGAILIQYGQSSIKISKSTPRLDGPVIGRYLTKLQLGPATGIIADEFQLGASPERQQIHRFIAALRRLAKT